MIRTTSDLIDKIAEDLVWRRRELTDLRALIQSNGSNLRTKVLIRSAIALLYAHWEGFVKNISSYYLEYVSSQRLPYRKLAPNFIGLKLRSKFSEMGGSEKLSSGNECAHFFTTQLDKHSNIPFKKVIDTKSNLSSKVLLDIIESIGLDKNTFATKFNFIDTNLVSRRNYVAHGEDLSITINEYLELHDEVIGLIESYRIEIENSAILKKFEVAPI